MSKIQFKNTGRILYHGICWSLAGSLLILTSACTAVTIARVMVEVTR